MKTLKEFQKTDADIMRSIGNSLALHEPGCGKTAIGTALINGRTLIIVPKSVLFQYADEITAFRPSLCPAVVTGTPAKRKNAYLSPVGGATVILCTYESFRIDIGIIAGLPAFNTILFDEVHRLASTTTKTHKAIRNLLAYYRKQNYPAPRIHGFTASLIMNSPMDCFGVFSVIRPGLFPNYLYFVNEYMYKHPTFGYILGARTSKLSKLGDLIRPFYVRRTLAEVAPQLPPHIDEVISFELSAKETKLYSDIRAELLLEIDPPSIDLVKNPISLQNALTKLQKLSELTDSPDLIGHSGIPSTKISVLQEKLQELLSGNQRKAVIYSWFARRLAPLLAPLLAEYNPVTIVGSQSNEDRAEAMHRFKTDPACRVMLLSKAGSEGISLEEAQYLIRLDTPFSIGRSVQLTGRIRRITSVEPTFSYTLVAKGTCDEHMLKILQRKVAMNETIFSLNDIKELLDTPF
jgi:SNF2 family DNA or RNA helicase